MPFRNLAICLWQEGFVDSRQKERDSAEEIGFKDGSSASQPRFSSCKLDWFCRNFKINFSVNKIQLIQLRKLNSKMDALLFSPDFPPAY